MASEAMLCELLTHPESMVVFVSLRHLFCNAYHPPSDGQNAPLQQFQRFLLHSLKLTKSTCFLGCGNPKKQWERKFQGGKTTHVDSPQCEYSTLTIIYTPQKTNIMEPAIFTHLKRNIIFHPPPFWITYG